jgi:hypothetical protein
MKIYNAMRFCYLYQFDVKLIPRIVYTSSMYSLTKLYITLFKNNWRTLCIRKKVLAYAASATSAGKLEEVTSAFVEVSSTHPPVWYSFCFREYGYGKDNSKREYLFEIPVKICINSRDKVSKVKSEVDKNQWKIICILIFSIFLTTHWLLKYCFENLPFEKLWQTKREWICLSF